MYSLIAFGSIKQTNPAIKYTCMHLRLSPTSSLRFQCLICKKITLDATQHLFLSIKQRPPYYHTMPKEFGLTSGFGRQRAKCQQAHFPAKGWCRQESSLLEFAGVQHREAPPEAVPLTPSDLCMACFKTGSNPWQVHASVMQHLRA